MSTVEEYELELERMSQLELTPDTYESLLELHSNIRRACWSYHVREEIHSLTDRIWNEAERHREATGCLGGGPLPRWPSSAWNDAVQ